MKRVKLTDGTPSEPDTGDWNAICETPGPRHLFGALFHEIAGGMPAAAPAQVDEDATHRVHTIWFGTTKFGVEVTETESAETTAFPMYCKWETFGLPGMKVTWNYALEYAGQLGYAAFRHKELVCEFDTDRDQERFAEIWRRFAGTAPVFAPA